MCESINNIWHQYRKTVVFFKWKYDSLFLNLQASGTDHNSSIDNNAYTRIGFLHVERISVRTQCDLERLLEAFHNSIFCIFPEMISYKKARSDTKKRDKEDGETIDHMVHEKK